METKYFPETDQLCISLSSSPALGGGSQISEGIWFFYDDEGKVVSIEIEFASDKVNLSGIKDNPSVVMKESTNPILTWTVSELAKEWGVTSRTIQRAIAKMVQAGKNVGKQLGPTYPIVLFESDVEAIRHWRKRHRAGRPRAETV